MIKHNQDYDNENVYIGSCCNFTRRKCGHKTVCNNPNDKDYNLKLYQTIRENGGWDEWVMLKLHDFSCNEKYELNLEERRVIDLYKSKLNKSIPTRTYKEYRDDNKDKYNEYHKKYRDDNKDKYNEYHKKYRDENKEKESMRLKKYYDENKEQIKENQKKYYDENKEKINEYHKKYRDENKEKISEKITCECGSIVRKCDISTHRKTLKHISFLDNAKTNQ